jgi:hypothetical protein
LSIDPSLAFSSSFTVSGVLVTVASRCSSNWLRLLPAKGQLWAMASLRRLETSRMPQATV